MANDNLIGQMFVAYVSNNNLEPSQVENVVRAIRRALSTDSSDLEFPAGIDPAVPVDQSISPDYLTCLEDGLQFKSLKRHLGIHGLSPDEYRSKWGLPNDYPMVAPKYSKARSRLAKKIGLGRKRKGA
jgi:MucR family transcriptional regulator, transcriptional regulator of exopolysaccharide biosynthesis